MDGWIIAKFLNAIGGENDVSRWKRVRDQKVPHLETFTYTLRVPDDPDLVDILETLGIV